jgi:signal transduction histidine kinase
MVMLVGYLDYISGVENSMLLLYLVPIALATSMRGIPAGIIVSVLSISAWVASDVFAGIARVNIWNVLSGFGCYSLIVFLLARWRELLKQMHSRIEERTAALRRELAARKQLEAELAAIAERERERLGRELHDGLCQHLTGTSLVAQTVSIQIRNINSNISEQARKVVALIDEGIEMTREIARGLLSFELDAGGLAAALESLAKTVTHEQGIDCKLAENIDVTIAQPVANHLYWITREAVANAVKHGHAGRILINLRQRNGTAELKIEDDGIGFSKLDGVESRGLGLKLMTRRAELAGGVLQIADAVPRGVIIRCEVQICDENE